MYVIIAGCRKVGSSLAMELAQENHDVVVIDSDPERFKALGSGFNGVTITGMPIDEDVLRDAGAVQADALAAVTEDDNMNIMISQVAKELFHVPTVITRLYDPRRETIMSGMGLTTVCPTTLAVQQIKSQLLSRDLLGTHIIRGVSVSFRTVMPPKKQIGKSIAVTDESPVLGVLRDNRFIPYDGKVTVLATDLLVIALCEDREE